jgi:hypothetical protein
MTARLRFMILPNTVNLQRALAGMSGWPSWRLVHRACGNLVIPRLHAMTASAQSRMRAKPDRPPH